MYQVVKRDGKVTEFEISKISNAITKAFEALGKQYHPSVIDMLALRVTAEYEPLIRDGKSPWKAFRTAWRRSCPKPATPMWQRRIFCTVNNVKRSAMSIPLC